MLERLKYRQNTIFWIFIGIYACLGLYNLETLPVAWTDETMNLDPAIQFTKFHHYFSKLWPNPGAENLFASYPPLIQFWHILWLKLVQPTIFNVRLPFLLMHLCTLYFLFHLFKEKSVLFSAFLVILFATDKSVFEMSRSVRIEVIILFLLSLYYFLNQKGKIRHFNGFILGLLAISHLYVLPLIMVIGVKNMAKNNLKENSLFILSALLPILFSLFFIDFNINEIFNQLGLQAKKHTPETHGIIQYVSSSFLHRFWPYYLEMPLHFALYLAIFSANIYAIFKQIRKTHLLILQNYTLELFAFSATIFFLLSPQYRYLPVFLLIGLLFLRDIDLKIKPSFKPFAFSLMLLMIINGMFSFGVRHSIAIIQRNERISEPFLAFLASNIPQNKKTLILGESIGEYYAANRKYCDYGLDFHPQHFKFSDYEQVFYLSKNELPFAKKIETYCPAKTNIPQIALRFAKGGTYSNTILWKVETAENFKKITAPFLEY